MGYNDYNYKDSNQMQSQPAAQQTPSKKTRSQKRMNPGLYMLMILAISVALSAMLLTSANDMFAFIKDDRDTTVTVAENTTISGMSKELGQEKIINHRFLFSLFLKLTQKDTNVLAGDYVLNPNMDYSAIIRSLKSGSGGNNTVEVTIPEGYTIQQIRETLLSKHVCEDESALDKALTEYRYSYDFLKDVDMSDNWLEGYLFPDTYQFYVNDSAVNVVDKMLSNFEKKYDSNIQDGADKLNLSMHEVVTIASLIEREAKLEDEYTMISGVIHNRLNNSNKFPYLQIDATVQYAVGHKDALTSEDLEVDSPYNTYKYKGLPPGPIASPGYTSLYAATHPDTHDYYYYVAMPDGSHLFAGTLSKHNANIQTANAAFAAQGDTQ